MSLSRRQFLSCTIMGAALPALVRLPHLRHETRVRAESAPVRQWAADDAPMVVRLAQHTPVTVTDQLATRDGEWIAVRDATGRTGWSRAALWSLSPGQFALHTDARCAMLVDSVIE